ncbi:MAG: hypothetical protein JF597_38525 [Streptomyces sp.]|uniref:hypothetical protein n=1 Tax=Streptomyces sp. TaxID=1931 RepID=UPI0025F079B2|nr:hypothetical protein [Streptomyces sp.]MBW8799257.1 hypothetical protein [Streptomyces sp.]
MPVRASPCQVETARPGSSWTVDVLSPFTVTEAARVVVAVRRGDRCAVRGTLDLGRVVPAVLHHRRLDAALRRGGRDAVAAVRVRGAVLLRALDLEDRRRGAARAVALGDRLGVEAGVVVPARPGPLLVPLLIPP